MKTKFFTLLASALLLSSISFAHLFRVGYVGPLITGVDFSNENSAYAAANNGDTLQFYPQGSNEVDYSISPYNKSLVLIGNGYLLSDPSYVNNAGLNMITGKVGLSITPTASSTGSNGTIMEGFQYADIFLSTNVTLTSVTITRCNTGGFQGNSSMTGVTLTNCSITQCFDINYDPTNGAGNSNITLTNYEVENCLFNLPSINAALNPSSTILISNCFIQESPRLGNNNVVVQNCIFDNNAESSAGVANAVFNNCIFSGTSAVTGITGSNNQFNVNISGTGANVFVGIPTQGTYSQDAKYQITSTSPAKGAGIGGVDIGIFGGTNPYVLSGIPAVPAFYQLQASTPNATTNPYQITVSVRSNN